MLSSLVRKWAQKQKEEWEEMSEGGVSGSLGHREVESGGNHSGISVGW